MQLHESAHFRLTFCYPKTLNLQNSLLIFIYFLFLGFRSCMLDYNKCF